MLVTGHTGFKGVWLAQWLRELGANVVGLSDGVHGSRSHFVDADLGSDMEQHWVDIRNGGQLTDVVAGVKPDFVFHLAAQPLVTESYVNPIETFETNVMGTANVLEALRSTEVECTAIMVTSDKCYENTDTYYGYRETDPLGGADPYSASKGAAEIVIAGYLRSFFSDDRSANVGIVRSGNVIGGGDWSADRIVPDIVRAWEKDEAVMIRRPAATRPWQHVLEPLAGYLHLGARLRADDGLHAEAFNFGPSAASVRPVSDLVDAFQAHLSGLKSDIQQDGWNHEAAQLGLNCDKAVSILNWFPVLGFDESIAETAHWYSVYVAEGASAAANLTVEQIQKYAARADTDGSAWASSARSAA